MLQREHPGLNCVLTRPACVCLSDDYHYRTAMNLYRRPILIDTDTASDDAVALIMALRSPSIDVKAITTVAGNVGVEQATRNALFTVELCDADVPVFSGAAKPLESELQTDEW